MASLASIARPEPNPRPMFRPLTDQILAPVVAALVEATQAVDPQSTEPVAFDLWPGYIQARVNFVARGAIRACFQSVLRDAELRARASVAEIKFQRPFDRLSPREQAQVFETAKAAVNAYQRHIEGLYGEFLPSERESLKLPGELS
jgi:hypothetical protein